MAALTRCLPLLMVIAAGGACTPLVKEAIDSFPGAGPTVSAFLLVDRWHAGVAIKVSDIPGNLVPERRDFTEAQYLEFGWGDWDFYQAPNVSSGDALKALLFPTKSVMTGVSRMTRCPGGGNSRARRTFAPSDQR